MMTRKTAEQIKEEILSCLNDRPLSIEQIRIKVDSNWSTVNNYLDELAKEEKVKELISTEKIKIFKRTYYPVFYGLPIAKKYREETLFIAAEIVKEWKIKYNGELPLNTTLQKVAVEVIKECNLNLPVLPLHYGLVTAVALKPSELKENTYTWTGNIKKEWLIKFIKNEVPKHKNNASDEEDAQYNKYGLKLFQTRKEIVNLFKKSVDNINLEEVDKKILRMSFLLSTDNLEVYNLFDRFVSSSIIIFMSKEPKKNLSEIREAFDTLWELITSDMFLKDARKFVLPEDISLFELIKSFHLNSKICTSEERVSNLESVSGSINPDELDVPMDEESIEIRKIMTKGLGRE